VPINSVSTYLVDLLNGLPLPGPAGAEGNLAAFITPPDPGTLTVPTAYLWPISGEEKRLTSPRAGGPNVIRPGWKHIIHKVPLFLAWVGLASDPTADTNFAAVIDAIMAVLRPSPDEVEITDPVTGQITSLILGIGEELSYEYSVVHSLADQRLLRYDCRLTITAEEYFQS
jgi:hypothetical protein